MLRMFSGLILACGTTHFLSLAALWTPVDRLEGLVKLATVLLSVLTPPSSSGAPCLGSDAPQPGGGPEEAAALFRTLAEGIPSMAWVRRNDGS